MHPLIKQHPGTLYFTDDGESLCYVPDVCLNSSDPNGISPQEWYTWGGLNAHAQTELVVGCQVLPDLMNPVPSPINNQEATDFMDQLVELLDA